MKRPTQKQADDFVKWFEHRHRMRVRSWGKLPWYLRKAMSTKWFDGANAMMYRLDEYIRERKEMSSEALVRTVMHEVKHIHQCKAYGILNVGKYPKGKWRRRIWSRGAFRKWTLKYLRDKRFRMNHETEAFLINIECRHMFGQDLKIDRYASYMKGLYKGTDADVQEAKKIYLEHAKAIQTDPRLSYARREWTAFLRDNP